MRASALLPSKHHTPAAEKGQRITRPGAGRFSPFSLPAADQCFAHIFPCQKNDLRLRLPPPKRRRSQVVRQWSAKPLFSGSNPLAASSENQKGSANAADPFFVRKPTQCLSANFLLVFPYPVK